MSEMNTGRQKLDDLYSERAKIDSQILAETVRLVREKGLAFESLEDLVARHPGAQVVRDGFIKESYSIKSPGQGLAKYSLNGVKVKVKDGEKVITEAYDCDNCGIVLGEYLSKPYDDHGPLCGSEGNEYSCKICGARLGRHAWKHY